MKRTRLLLFANTFTARKHLSRIGNGLVPERLTKGGRTTEKSKKKANPEDKQDVLKDLEYLLTEVPEDSDFPASEESEEEYQSRPWKGLDWVSKAKTLNEMERYREAIEQCDEALSINPGDPKALFVKGEAYRGLGNYEKAIDCYDKAVRGSPNDDEIWYAKGIVLKQMGKNLEALAAFEKATDVEDAHHDAWYERAVVLRLLGRHEESRSCLEKAFRHYPFEDRRKATEKTEDRELPKPEVTSEDYEEETEEDDEGSLDNLDALLGDLMKETDGAPQVEMEKIPFDQEDEKILLSTMNQSMNIQQISAMMKMPLVSCYKKVRRMEELGLLRRVKVKVVESPKKKRIGYYRTNLKKVKLFVNQGRMSLGIEFKRLLPSDGGKEGSDVAMPPHS